MGSSKSKKSSHLKAYGYVRVSTEEQAKEGISLDAQKEKIKAFAVVHDLELVDIISDEGYSGKNMARPGLQKLIDLTKGQAIEAVIVYKLDRLSRKTRDLLFLIEDSFKKGNTRFFSLTEQIDTDTAMGKFFLTLMGAMAQMERELIAERTKATLAYKKDCGDSLGHIPYGNKRVNGKLVEDPDEQRVIREIKKLRRQGKSYRKIACILNDQGIPTRGKKAKWHDSSVWCVLKWKKRKKSRRVMPVL
ncbi:MAG: recombinase family protein [Nitrospirota bacterium]